MDKRMIHKCRGGKYKEGSESGCPVCNPIKLRHRKVKQVSVAELEADIFREQPVGSHGALLGAMVNYDPEAKKGHEIAREYQEVKPAEGELAPNVFEEDAIKDQNWASHYDLYQQALEAQLAHCKAQGWMSPKEVKALRLEIAELADKAERIRDEMKTMVQLPSEDWLTGQLSKWLLKLLQGQRSKGQKPMPEIICLCGSTRFVDTFNEWRKKLTLKGKIVLSIEIVTTQTRQEDPQHSNPEIKAMLDELHLRKIDLCNTVMVLNVEGYIGESTSKEIAYAQSKGKKITYLESPMPEVPER